MRLRRYAPPLWAGIVGLVTFFVDISVAGTLLPFFVDDVLHAPSTVVGIATTLGILRRRRLGSCSLACSRITSDHAAQ